MHCGKKAQYLNVEPDGASSNEYALNIKYCTVAEHFWYIC